MKTIIALMIAVSITGCASNSWTDFKLKNNCEFAGKTKTVTVMTSQNMPTVGGYSSSLPVPMIRTMYLYNCESGQVWTMYSPK